MHGLALNTINKCAICPELKEVYSNVKSANEKNYERKKISGSIDIF